MVGGRVRRGVLGNLGGGGGGVGVRGVLGGCVGGFAV